MTIAIICPTRARPEGFKRMVESAKMTAYKADNLKFYMALRDEDREIYTSDILRGMSHRQLMPDGMPTSYKWNFLADHALKDGCTLFMLASDDIVFTTPHWDKALMEAYNNAPQVFSLRDSRDMEGTPHPIVSKEYIHHMGYFLPPIFLHWFVDTWTVDIAKANDCFMHLKDYLLIHNKGWDKKQPDDTYNFLHRAGWLNCDRRTNELCKHFLEAEKQRLRFLMKEKAA